MSKHSGIEDEALSTLCFLQHLKSRILFVCITHACVLADTLAVQMAPVVCSLQEAKHSLYKFKHCLKCSTQLPLMLYLCLTHSYVPYFSYTTHSNALTHTHTYTNIYIYTHTYIYTVLHNSL